MAGCSLSPSLISRFPIIPKSRLFTLSGPGVTRNALSALSDFAPDVIIAEGTWAMRPAARWARRLGCRVVFSVQAIESVVLEQRGALWPITAMVKRFEQRTFPRGDLQVTMSPGDADLLASRYGLERARIMVVPNGVDCTRFGAEGPDMRAAWGLVPQQPVVLFTGKADYPPNSEALRWLDDEIIPLCNNENIAWMATGPGTPPPMRRVRHVGIVDDVVAALRTADVCVVPLLTGSGTSLKTLEFLAAEKPVVSTSTGARGLGLVDGQHIRIADDKDSFVGRIEECLSVKPEVKAMAKSGSKWVRERFDWDAIYSDFMTQLNELVINIR
jgi:glycosyltransferase involved in cell wall biosynthesis